jgi:hypothetical protein
MRVIARLLFLLTAAVSVAIILSDGALADAKKMPLKIDEPTANRLAAEGADHGATTEDLLYEDAGSEKRAPFFVYYGLSRPPREGTFGYFAVNPWTGDVWALWGCQRLSTPALRKSQAEIRKQFTREELTQYAKLRRLRPQCIYG